MDLQPAQCRAARGLLDISQLRLAELAGVSVRTIAYFETGERMSTPETRAALRAALEAAGVQFLKDGVKLR